MPISSKRPSCEPKDLPAIDFKGFETRAIHAGTPVEDATGSRDTPIHMSTSFVFRDADHGAKLFNLAEVGNIYSRLTNPTVSALQSRLADLEGGCGAVCTSCGHSAQLLALFAVMEPGDTVVAATRLYGGSVQQLTNMIRKFGWSCEFVDVDDLAAVKTALQKPKVKALFIESLANPGAVVADISALADAAHTAGVPLMVDNTLATPYLCNPLAHGADIVIHSTTKFLSGHGSCMGGVVIDSGKFDWTKYPEKFPSLASPNPAYHGLNFAAALGPMAFTFYGIAIGLRDLGLCLSPFNAWCTLTNIATLPLRMEKHCANAKAVAEMLEKHPKVAWVSYPTLSGNKYGALAGKYLKGQGGAILTFGVKGGYEAGIKVTNSLRLFSQLANLGDVRSLVIHPASTTHRQLTDEAREKAGVPNDAVRLSVGIESLDDIVLDLNTALSQV